MHKALLFGGTDGHGATMTVISERNLCSDGYDVTTVCEYVVTSGKVPAEQLATYCGTGQPKTFWGVTFHNWDCSTLQAGDLVVVVDIPLPITAPGEKFLANAAELGLAKIAELVKRGIRVVLVDHHKASETLYGRATAVGAEVVLASTAMATHYGPQDVFAEKWGRIGAIVDRDQAVLPITEEEELLAEGLDGAVKRQEGIFPAVKDVGLQESLAALRLDDSAYFLKFVESVPEPKQPIEVYGKVAYLPILDPRWGYKQLDRVCKDSGCVYGIGLNLSRGAAVICITYWKSQALPVALKLGETKFRGHPGAIFISVASTGNPATAEETQAAEQKAQEIITRLNSETDGDGKGGGNGSPGDLFTQVAAFLKAVRIPFFLTQHGWDHVERVISHGRSLGSLFGLSHEQQRTLDWAALLHDIGNGAASVYPEEGLTDAEARKRHHEFSARMIQEWAEKGLFDGIMSREEAELVANLALAHRKSVALPENREERLLAVLLRVADGIDIDARRAQKNDQGLFFEELHELPEESRPHWQGHRAIAALRLVATKPRLSFEVLVSDREQAAFQVKELTKELAPLTEFSDWEVRVLG